MGTEMPLYVYVCPDCGTRLDLLQPVDEPPPACPVCDEPMMKRLQPPALKRDGAYSYREVKDESE